MQMVVFTRSIHSKLSTRALVRSALRREVQKKGEREKEEITLLAAAAATTTTAHISSSSRSKSNQLLARFLASIRSDATRRVALAYVNAFMKYWKLYEEGQNNDNNNLVYRYDWLLPPSSTSAAAAGSAAAVVVDIETIQDRIIQFVIDKKQQGFGARAIDNYTKHLQKFYRVNGVKVGLIDWDLIHNYFPDYVKKQMICYRCFLMQFSKVPNCKVIKPYLHRI